MASLTLALVLGTALGLLFVDTRRMGVLGAALLCFLYPGAFCAVLRLAVAVYFFFNFPRR